MRHSASMSYTKSYAVVLIDKHVKHSYLIGKTCRLPSAAIEISIELLKELCQNVKVIYPIILQILLWLLMAPHKVSGRHFDQNAFNLLLSLSGLVCARPRQNSRHFADDTFIRIFLNENVRISIKISLKFVLEGPINSIPALVQIMAWRRPGDKPLSEPMMVSSLTYICVTRPQWGNNNYEFFTLHFQTKALNVSQNTYRYISGEQNLVVDAENIPHTYPTLYIVSIWWLLMGVGGSWREGFCIHPVNP